MNPGFRSIIAGVLSSFRPAHQIPARSMYYSEKIARGPIVKRYGYVDKIERSGILPRIKDAKRLPSPPYKPGNNWSEIKRVEGRNDYIDILGNGKIKPHEILYDVPGWLRGKKGNEFQMLLLKRKVFCRTDYEYKRPTTWNMLNKRIKYLYKYLNLRTKTGPHKQ